MFGGRNCKALFVRLPFLGRRAEQLPHSESQVVGLGQEDGIWLSWLWISGKLLPLRVLPSSLRQQRILFSLGCWRFQRGLKRLCKIAPWVMSVWQEWQEALRRPPRELRTQLSSRHSCPAYSLFLGTKSFSKTLQSGLNNRGAAGTWSIVTIWPISSFTSPREQAFSLEPDKE